MKVGTGLHIVITGLFFIAALAAAPMGTLAEAASRSGKGVKASPKAKPTPAPTVATLNQGSLYRGWDYLVQKLLDDGISRPEIDRVYRSRQMPHFTFVQFGLAPRESHASYAGFLKEDKIRRAMEFIKEHRHSLEDAERLYGVSRFVITAILLVETQFGKVTGRQQIFYRLSRVASVKDPRNLELNFKELKKKDPTVTLEQVISRANYLEETFYPEIPALFEIARRREVDVLQVKGSFAGAFGLPQFLPSSYLRYAVDGNRDGTVSLYDRYDAIHSTAHYLKNFGWRDDAALDAKRQAIWAYNRSDAYIDTVLSVSDILKARDSTEKLIGPPKAKKTKGTAKKR